MTFYEWWGAWIESYAKAHGLQGFAITENNAPTRKEAWEAGYAAATAECDAIVLKVAEAVREEAGDVAYNTCASYDAEMAIRAIDIDAIVARVMQSQ